MLLHLSDIQVRIRFFFRFVTYITSNQMHTEYNTTQPILSDVVLYPTHLTVDLDKISAFSYQRVQTIPDLTDLGCRRLLNSLQESISVHGLEPTQ